MLTNEQRLYLVAQVDARIRVLERDLSHQTEHDQAPWRHATEEELKVARATLTALRATSHPAGAREAAYWLHAQPDDRPDGPGVMREWEVRRTFPGQPVTVLCHLASLSYEEAMASARWLAHELFAAATDTGEGDVVERSAPGIDWLGETARADNVWLCWHVTWTGGDGATWDPSPA